MINDILFPESMEKTEGLDDKEVLKIHDDYIRYIVERIRFAFNGYTNKKKFIDAIEDVVEDGPLAKELMNEKGAREQAVIELNEKLDKAEGLYTTVDEETGIVYLHDKQEEPGLLPPYTVSRTVIKVTSEAIGISKDGGVTYSWGISLDDGTAILEKIYAIGIDADHITTGRITDNAGKYSLDLETGEVNMASANITGGSLNIDTSNAEDNKITLRHLGVAANTTDTLSPETINLHMAHLNGGPDVPPSQYYDDLIIRAARLWMRRRNPTDGFSSVTLDVDGLYFGNDGANTASYPANPLTWQNFTPATGTAAPFQYAKYLNVVDLYGGLNNLPSGSTTVNLGTFPCKPRNTWAIIPTYSTAAPYLQNGSIWISTTGEITLYKSSTSTGCYFGGTFVCQN